MVLTHGSCLCGKIAFEAKGEPIRINHCHCSRCQKSRGTGHATNLVLPISGFRFERGAELIRTYRVPDAKFFAHVFCSECGSTLPRVDEARQIVIVPMGSLDDDPKVRPERHIFVDSKAPWEEIADDLPKLPGAPPSL
jgi:hypothetical protein